LKKFQNLEIWPRGLWKNLINKKQGPKDLKRIGSELWERLAAVFLNNPKKLFSNYKES
jgi:hypothetical protein